MDQNNSNIDNVMIIMVPRKELICLSKFIQVLPKLISEALDVLRGKIGKSIDNSVLGHLSKESLDKLVNDRNYCILCPPVVVSDDNNSAHRNNTDTFKSKGALRFHYRLKHSKELKEMNSVFSNCVLGKRMVSEEPVHSEFL